ncbi:MAG: bifunctional methylenetetrahydrofolate dehydrogenase/methenyltetrahydrofolate cyclohydrolase FolD [Clostridia bacterium]|nr:bifunctional methylenetetrahydrofolate dehydrogenase/methenyltetrahydrofolate cyclohydrolase FolD [Clostridia bacterium]
MATTIIDGRAVAAAVRERIKKSTEEFINRTGITPGLAVVLVGEDPASQVYVRNKHRACGEVGFLSRVYTLPASTTEDELLALIAELNADREIHGILVQLPLPKHISESRVILAIDPKKDVDAFHPQNVGGIMTGDYKFVPCTPAGVMELLAHYGIDPSGKSAVVVGRSNIVGKPQALLLLEKNATVTVCHSRTRDLAAVTRTADILVVAVGRAKMITGDMVKEGAVVIDVGMNRLDDGKLCGDVDFDSVFPVASHITPVPGGVGPMTITMLLCNTLRAAEDAAAKPCH